MKSQKKKRKNNKKVKTFGINFKADEDLFQSMEQLDILCDSFRPTLMETLIKKGYTPVKLPRLIPLENVDKSASKSDYRYEVEAIYVGKKKSMERR